MVSEELLALATAGGTALVAAAAKDAWEVASSGFARLFGKGDEARERDVSAQLDRTRAAITADPANVTEAERQQLVWATRLEDLLSADPSAPARLRDLISEIGAAAGTNSAGHVVQHNHAHDQAQQANLGHGSQTVNFGTPPAK